MTSDLHVHVDITDELAAVLTLMLYNNDPQTERHQENFA